MTEEDISCPSGATNSRYGKMRTLRQLGAHSDDVAHRPAAADDCAQFGRLNGFGCWCVSLKNCPKQCFAAFLPNQILHAVLSFIKFLAFSSLLQDIHRFIQEPIR